MVCFFAILHPKATLRRARQRGPRARFLVIDVHCHLNDGIVMSRAVNPEQFIRVMDEHEC